MRLRRVIQLACLFLVTLLPAAAGGAVSPDEAARFLTQATLGPTSDEIERTAAMGFDAWLDEQFDRPVGYQQPYLDQRTRSGLEVTSEHRRWSWWTQIMDGPDPLRQRIALALSEHFVISDNLGRLADTPHGMANYFDMLLDNTFGNYRDMLFDISLHPVMGAYLSHLQNEKTASGRFPDENYAREIMQLFSIGLYELHPDGSFVLDGNGEPIPTYDNGEITELAKIFTGLSFDGPDSDFSEGREVWTVPMRMYPQFHEPGEKFLLRGKYVPAGQTPMDDIHDAIDNLFEHPNVGPFVGRRLIQRLVTSNPSPGYLERVSTVFADNGAGVRGDMRAVISAILLDPEARDQPVGSGIHDGMLRESFLRRVHLARAFEAANPMSSYPISDNGAPDSFAQRPFSSPSVFNFFLPDHRPTGPISMAGLVAPEFQIINSMTVITSANALARQIEGAMNSSGDPMLEVRLNLSEEMVFAADVRALIDRLDRLLMHGEMSQAMQQILIQALQQLPDQEERVKMAVYLISISPEYCVLK